MTWFSSAVNQTHLSGLRWLTATFNRSCRNNFNTWLQWYPLLGWNSIKVLLLTDLSTWLSSATRTESYHSFHSCEKIIFCQLYETKTDLKLFISERVSRRKVALCLSVSVINLCSNSVTLRLRKVEKRNGLLMVKAGAKVLWPVWPSCRLRLASYNPGLKDGDVSWVFQWFGSLMSALPLTVMKNSTSIGLFTHLDYYSYCFHLALACRYFNS